MKLSIVTTLYRSAAYVEAFVARARAVAEAMAGDDFEIVMVNDGSPDDSLTRAVALTEREPHLMVVDLSRNFGHHKAMMTGLEAARGDLVFLIDSDLEEAPEWLADFDAKMEATGADVVYGQQASRKGSSFERWSGAAFYTVFNLLAGIDHPRNITTARLMTRRYVDALLLHRERELVISCLWVITGFEQVAHTVTKTTTSPTTYGLLRRISIAILAITSFSDLPLRLTFYVGSLILAASLGYGSWLAAQRIFWARPPDGWTALMLSVWILGGLIIFFIGVIGLYLARIFVETKNRPYTIIRSTYGQSKR